MAENVLLGLTFILVLGITASWLAWRLRLKCITWLNFYSCSRYYRFMVGVAVAPGGVNFG